MRSLFEIDFDIEIEKEKLTTVIGTECEVYTRIVGYYRPIKNWNKGQRQAFNERTVFDVPRQGFLNFNKNSS